MIYDIIILTIITLNDFPIESIEIEKCLENIIITTVTNIRAIITPMA